MTANPTAKTSQGMSTSRLAAVILTDPRVVPPGLTNGTVSARTAGEGHMVIA
jgi:hypothetical protein